MPEPLTAATHPAAHGPTEHPTLWVGDRNIVAVTAAATADQATLDDWDLSDVATAPDRSFIVGRYIHGGHPPNRNGHLFKTEELPEALRYLPFTALDMLHDARRIVGTHAATKMVYPSGTALTNPTARSDPYGATPYSVVLACMWSYLFPDDAKTMASAFEEGNAFLSHSTLPLAGVSCDTCGHTAPWAGYTSTTYCDHMQGTNPKWMNQPLFLGGAVIVPPVKPGWHAAQITKVEAFMRENPQATHEAYTELAARATTDDPKIIEALTAQVLSHAYADDPAMAKSVSRMVAVAAGHDWEKTAGGYSDIDFTVPADAAWVAADAGRELTPTEVREIVDMLDGTDDPLMATAAAWAHDVYVQMVQADLAAMAPGDDARRQRLAGDGSALGDGSFAVASLADIPKAIVAWPRATDLERTKRHLLARAAALTAPASLIAQLEELGRAEAQTAAQQGHTGVIVAMVPPKHIREQLAAVGDEPEGEIHVTLAFLGKTETTVVSLDGDGTGQVTFEQLHAAVSAWAVRERPLVATISGPGAFDQGDIEVTVALVDSPGLSALHTRLVEAFDAAEIPWSVLHGFTPHLTVAYREPGAGPEKIPTGLTWPVTEVEIWWGDIRRTVQLG